MKRFTGLLMVFLLFFAFSCSNEVSETADDQGQMIKDEELFEIAANEGVEQAIARYKELKAEHPQIYSVYVFDNVLNRVGLRLFGNGYREESLEILKLNVDEFPEQHNPWDSLGMVLTRMGEYQEAKECFNKALRIKPDFQDSINGLYNVYNEIIADDIKNYGVDKAIENYRILLASGSEEFDLTKFHANNHLNILGYRLLRAKLFPEAIKIFKLNIEAFPTQANPYDSVAEAYLLSGDFQNSEENYNKTIAISSDPDNPIYISGKKGLRRIYARKNYVKKEYRIPMRDGKTLFTQVYAPKDKKDKYPILLRRTPYRVLPYGEDFREEFGPSELFTEAGYIFVYQDVRGRFMSEGEFVHMRPINTERGQKEDIDESTDTFDTIEWLLKNIGNNNGKVGMYGTSYPGAYSAMALVNAHPALVAVSPQAPPMDWFMGDDFHRNGVFYLLHAVNFLRMNAIPHEGLITEWPQIALEYPVEDLYHFFLDLGSVANVNEKYFKGKLPFWNQMMEHGNYDDFWKERNIAPHLKGVKAAVLNVGGWYDAENLYGTLKCYQAIEEQNPGITNVLVMGPWYHGGWDWSENDYLGDIKSNSRSAMLYFKEKIELPFFDFYLKGKGSYEKTEALIFDVGTNEWKRYKQWPVESGEATNIYLSSGKKLSFDKPSETGNSYFDQYSSDPAAPAPHHKDKIIDWDYSYMHADQRHNYQRDDVLSYSFNTLEKDITLSGPIDVELYVATTGTDADYIVKIIDVYPEDAPDTSPRKGVKMAGYQTLIRGEAMRARFRNSFEKPEPLTPGKIEKIKFEIRDIHYTFKKGHKIMVQVQSHWFPVFDRNPQKYVDIYNAKENDFRKEDHKIYRSREYPSNIMVRVIK